MKHEQFTNPHYQKILKAVIKHRYPELSFEDGLKMECNDKIHCMVLMECQGITDILSYENASKFIDLDLLKKAISNKILKFQIFGRLITICEIVDVLAANGEQYFYDGQGHIVKYMSTPAGYIHAIKVILCNKSRILHEQPIEVQEKIANLFN